MGRKADVQRVSTYTWYSEKKNVWVVEGKEKREKGKALKLAVC